jgi:hypothetical protein
VTDYPSFNRRIAGAMSSVVSTSIALFDVARHFVVLVIGVLRSGGRPFSPRNAHERWQQTTRVGRSPNTSRCKEPTARGSSPSPNAVFNIVAEEGSGDKIADASAAAITELLRSLNDNHAASDDLWQEAIDATLSFANEAS